MLPPRLVCVSVCGQRATSEGLINSNTKLNPSKPQACFYFTYLFFLIRLLYADKQENKSIYSNELCLAAGRSQVRFRTRGPFLCAGCMFSLRMRGFSPASSRGTNARQKVYVSPCCGPKTGALSRVNLGTGPSSPRDPDEW